MGTRANYFKIGLFVIAATAIAIIAVVYMGAGALFRKKLLMETYIDESVQGLEIGSAVRYRGVKIGAVDKIDFAHNIYSVPQKMETRYVMVCVGLYPEAFPNIPRDAIGDVDRQQQALQKEIDRGLRVRLASAGMATGMLYLEVDYVDPERNPPMVPPWNPFFLYMPSTKSSMVSFLNSVDLILQKLEKTQIETVANDLHVFLEALTKRVEEADMKELSKQGVSLLTELRKTNATIQEVLDKKRLEAIVANAATTVKNSARLTSETEIIVLRLGRDADGVMKNLTEATENANAVAKQLNAFINSKELAAGLKDLGQTADGANAIFADSSESLALLNRTLKRLDSLVSRQQSNVDAILENIRLMSENLKALSAQAKQYPSYVIFGDPPTQPEKKK